MPLSVAAPAKINLSLDITGTRDDGYHLVDTVMQAVSLCDTVTVWESDQPGISLELTGAGADTLPADDTNTAWKAAALFREAVKKRGMEPAGIGIRIHKRIPFAAGLAGGSADAAGVLAALNRLYGSLLEEEELADLGGRVGADVPFCLLGGTAQATGIGTILTPLPDLPDCDIVIAKPAGGVSTAQAYQAVDRAFGCTEETETPLHRPRTSVLVDAVCSGSLLQVGRELCNVFEQALRLPETEMLKREMNRFHPLGCLMTGSGSAVFALFAHRTDAEKCAEALRLMKALPGGAPAVFLCRPFRGGPATPARDPSLG